MIITKTSVTAISTQNGRFSNGPRREVISMVISVDCTMKGGTGFKKKTAPSRRRGRFCQPTKARIAAGADASKPTMSSIPGSPGSAIVKSLVAIPTTINFASIPERSRYCRSAWNG